MTLKERIDSYIDNYNFKILPKIPIIISINGRNFSKITSLLDKPFCNNFSECMISTMCKLSSEIDGVIFSYQFNDEIILLLRNDQNIETHPWCDNKIQKISSIAASMATSHLGACISSMDLNLSGEALFTAQVFGTPNLMEAANTLIFKQQQNFHSSIQFACIYELLKKYDKVTIKEMLSGLSIDEKIDLLNQESKIDFNKYSLVFRRGAACYRAPQVIDGVMKNKWVINDELPIFTKDQSFLNNIIKYGADIYRNN